MNYRYLGYGVTNSNGIAKLDHDSEGNPIAHSYTGVGAGKVDLVASLDDSIDEGSILSETYSIIDALYYDDATSDNTSTYSKTNCTLVFDSDKYILTCSSDGNCYVQFEATGTALTNCLGKSMKFEFDIVSATANIRAVIYQQVNGSWSNVSSTGATSGNINVTSDINPSASRVQFRINANDLGTSGTCNLKNLMVYPI